MPRPLPLLPRLLAPETLPPLPLLCVLSDILFNSIVVVKQKVSLFCTIGKLQHQLCTTATKKKKGVCHLNFRFFDSCVPE
ncbi:unnamed protein product [Staurois parvus]|uniref:Secreted protein n=1 Tax=Staurois parvus TaxID=386267 RepID=A0ABN9HCM1_9NEOB|nr:unnamed protein product [Staurois parvus]